MSVREIEGLRWPEGDPGALRGIAAHAARLGLALEQRGRSVFGLGPIGWLGDASDAFAVSLAAQSHALGAGARAMHAADHALLALARVVEDGQQTVLAAARRLKEARDAAVAAEEHAITLRTQADQQAAMDATLLGPLGTATGFPGPSAAELAARSAERAARTARAHALHVQSGAERESDAAYDDVQRADRACARALEGLHLVPAATTTSPGAGPPPSPALAALGILLLGPGAGSDRALKHLLSTPPPPPPPPPKPAKKHNWWKLAAAGGLGLATIGLTVANVMQGGLDPLTDGLEVETAAGTATLGGEAIAGETVAGEAATGEAIAGDTAAGDAVAGEGAASAGRIPFRANTRHIFRKAPGHLTTDTPANRAMLQDAVKPGNLVGETRIPGGTISRYRETLADGRQVWVEVKNGGEITNGGVNTVARP